MNVSCYLNKEETEFFKDYPKGWLKALVLKEMRTAASREEETSQVDLTDKEQRWLKDRCYSIHDVLDDAMERHAEMRHGLAESIKESLSQVDEERAREHFPPKDVFGPRLKR